MKLLRGHTFGLREIPGQSRVKIAGPRAHGHACGRRESHTGVDALALAYRRKAGAVSEMGQHHPAEGHLRPGHAREFFHEIGVGQAVKTITLDTIGLIAPRDGKDLRQPRHVAMKSCVKARHLRQARQPLVEQIDHRNLRRQMLWGISADAPQLFEQRARDYLRLVVAGTAVYDAMAYCAERIEAYSLRQPVAQKAGRARVILAGDGLAFTRLFGGIMKCECSSRKTNAVDLAVQSAFRRIASLV